MLTLLIAMLAQDPAQPSQAELEAAILAHERMLFASPVICPPGARNCPKPPSRVTVTQFACDATGVDHKGEPFLVCRTSYRFSGGEFHGVRANMMCVPVRWVTGTADAPRWRVAIVRKQDECGTK
jgi:hypothetical protein